jgi:hypothetical protein
MKREKYIDVVTYDGDIKITHCVYRNPHRKDRTYDPHKSKYTPWHQGVTRFEHGNGKVIGTVTKVK